MFSPTLFFNTPRKVPPATYSKNEANQQALATTEEYFKLEYINYMLSNTSPVTTTQSCPWSYL